jgi:hypothetical protein
LDLKEKVSKQKQDLLDHLLSCAFPQLARRQRHIILSLILGWWIFFLILPGGHDILYYFVPAIHGEFDFNYPYWVRWIIQPLDWIPYPYSYWIWISIMPPLFAFGLRLNRGNPFQFFLSFPFAWVMWYFQLEALAAIGIALLFQGLKRSDYIIMGIGFVLASIKPHITGPSALLIWIWIPTWKERMKALSILAFLIVLSLLIFGVKWPVEWIKTISQPLFEESYNNASLFPIIGVFSFFIWIPTLLLPMKSLDRLHAVMASTLLSIPYVPVYSQLVLYFWAMPWWQWLVGQIIWFQFYTSYVLYPYCALLPIIMLMRIYWKVWRSRGNLP